MVKQALLTCLATLGLVGSAISACSSISVRKDWRNLSEDERQRFITAQQTLWTQKADSTTGLSTYESNFIKFHRANTPHNHQTPQFLPWHRRFLREYENELRKIDPSVSLPYWNWSDDARNLNESLIWSPDYFGGNGNEDADFCVQDGRYANWTLHLGGDLVDQDVDVTHCLRRIWKYGLNAAPQEDGTAFVSPPDVMNAKLAEYGSTGDFISFRRWLEVDHGTIHLGVGGFSPVANGDMSPVKCSPNDPIFWLHHTMVDHTWWRFQNVSSKSRVAYGGLPNDNADLPKTDPLWSGAKLTDVLYPWSDTVSALMDTEGDDNCYTYDE